MKTKLLPLLLMIFLLSNISAQEKEHTIKILNDELIQIRLLKDSIRNEFSKVNKQSKNLESKLYNIYWSDLKELELTIKDAFDKTDVISISATYQEVIKSIISLHNEITRINNFTDAQKVFGIDFTARLSEVVDRTLIKALDQGEGEAHETINNRRKNRLKTIVKSILENPVLGGLMRTNPVSSVAYSIINQLLAADQPFFSEEQHKMQLPVIPENYKDLKKEYPLFRASLHQICKPVLPSNKASIKEESIAEFTSSIRPMINLFDELSGINEQYESSLEVFMKASEQTIEAIKPLELAFYEILNARDRDECRNKISDFFNIGEDASLDLVESKLSDPKMQELEEFSKKVNEALLLLKNDFLKIITLEIELSNAYIIYFSSLKDGREGFPDFDQNPTILEKIEQFSQLNKNLREQKTRLEAITINR